MKKKLLCALLACLLLLSMGCAGEKPQTTLRIAALKGPTGMGLAYLMQEESSAFSVELLDAPDVVTGKFINGEIDIPDFTEYVRVYLIDGTLNDYDLENMAQMFFYFTAVCDFYGQYYDSLTKNRDVYLQQAMLSSKLLRWFDAHIEELRKALQELAIENERG